MVGVYSGFVHAAVIGAAVSVPPRVSARTWGGTRWRARGAGRGRLGFIERKISKIWTCPAPANLATTGAPLGAPTLASARPQARRPQAMPGGGAGLPLLAGR